MSLQGFYTEKGLALAAKVAAGEKLTITKVVAGSGQTAASSAVLSNAKQTLAVGTAQTAGQSAVLPVTLAEVRASQSYSLTELGVYARDPNAGEILYQVFRLSEGREITAGGENTYRFYLKETVGTVGVSVTCSPAGLITEEDFAPVRNRVQAISASSRSVTVAAEELCAYVAALPRLMTESLTITVTGGTLSERLNILEFYGPGQLFIQAAEGASVTAANGVYVVDNSCLCLLGGMTIMGVSADGAALLVYHTKCLHVNNCTIYGDAEETITCLKTTMGGTVVAVETGFHNGYMGVNVGHGANIELSECTGEGNRVGINAFAGTAYLHGSTSELLGGASNSKVGGLIVKQDGKLL